MNEKFVPFNENSGGSGKAPLLGTLERGLAILDLLAERRSVTVQEISHELDLKRSTVYRLVEMLRQRGYVESSEGTTGISLGRKALRIGLSAVSRTDILKVAPPYMSDIAATGHGTVFMAVPDGDSVVYVARQEGPQSLNLSARIGARRPMHCTGLGKAYLSALRQSEMESLVNGFVLTAQTPNTILSHAALVEEISAVRRRGYAIDDIENEPGVACVAAPVLDHRGVPVAAISIAGVAGEILPNTSELGELTAATARSLSIEMGWQDVD